MNRVCLLGCLAVLFTAPAYAGAPGVQEAERAYQAVDFSAAHALATQALEAGGATREDTARLYVLLGIASAALGNADEAKRNFIIALAVDPALKLDKKLSPKIREPYLEAQGYWAAASERLSIKAKPGRDAAHLVVRFSDPTRHVARLELRLARAGAPERTAYQLELGPETRFALPDHLRERDYEFALRALDRHGNVLAEQGTNADPELVPAPSGRYALEAPTQPITHARSYFLPATLGLAGFGSAAAAIVFHVKRERAAHEWNGPTCENAGQTRLAQCQTVDARRKSSEEWAIGFYAASGALLSGALIALVAGRAPEDPRARARLGCAPFGVGLSCQGEF